MFQFDLMTLLLLAFGAVGVTAWLKSLFTAITTKQNFVYPIVSFVICAIVAYPAGKMDLGVATQVLFVLLAMVELAYQVVVSTVLNLLARLGGQPSAQTQASIDALTTAVNEHEYFVGWTKGNLESMAGEVQRISHSLNDSKLSQDGDALLSEIGLIKEQFTAFSAQLNLLKEQLPALAAQIDKGTSDDFAVLESKLDDVTNMLLAKIDQLDKPAVTATLSPAIQPQEAPVEQPQTSDAGQEAPAKSGWN